jgi:hypothetical protein
VSRKIFHFEFFRQDDGHLVALEVNIRPPGGLTTEMFNYANDIDIYAEWAHIIVHNRFAAEYPALSLLLHRAKIKPPVRSFSS